tara:strand:- start:185 stop:433 length:249 start_codon:yes stop_codon:yes gene_type:complete
MWEERESPLRIERRFEFDNYQQSSRFMKEIDSLCKENKIYPNISFGSKFVSITIFSDLEEISIKEREFTCKINEKFTNLIFE